MSRFVHYSSDKKQNKQGYCKVWIEIARADRPHGVKGAVTVKFHDHDYAFLEQSDSILLIPANEKSSLNPRGETFEVEKIVYGHKVMLYLSGVDSRDQIESLLPFFIHFPKEELPELEDGQLYDHQIKGLKVIDQASEIELGEICEVYDNGAQKVVTISGATTFDLPWVDAFIKDIDLEKKIVRITKPHFI